MAGMDKGAGARIARITTGCASLDEFTETFRPLCAENRIFLPTSAPLPCGKGVRYEVALCNLPSGAPGKVVLRGTGEISESHADAENRHGIAGMVLELGRLDAMGRILVRELNAGDQDTSQSFDVSTLIDSRSVEERNAAGEPEGQVDAGELARRATCTVSIQGAASGRRSPPSQPPAIVDDTESETTEVADIADLEGPALAGPVAAAPAPVAAPSSLSPPALSSALNPVALGDDDEEEERTAVSSNPSLAAELDAIMASEGMDDDEDRGAPTMVASVPGAGLRSASSAARIDDDAPEPQTEVRSAPKPTRPMKPSARRNAENAAQSPRPTSELPLAPKASAPPSPGRRNSSGGVPIAVPASPSSALPLPRRASSSGAIPAPMTTGSSGAVPAAAASSAPSAGHSAAQDQARPSSELALAPPTPSAAPAQSPSQPSPQPPEQSPELPAFHEPLNPVRLETSIEDAIAGNAEEPTAAGRPLPSLPGPPARSIASLPMPAVVGGGTSQPPAPAMVKRSHAALIAVGCLAVGLGVGHSLSGSQDAKSSSQSEAKAVAEAAAETAPAPAVVIPEPPARELPAEPVAAVVNADAALPAAPEVDAGLAIPESLCEVFLDVPEGSQVLANGAAVTASGSLPCGETRFLISHPEHPTHEVVGTLAAGEPFTLAHAFASTKVMLQVLSSPRKSWVQLDGVGVGKTPLRRQVDAGKEVTVRISRAGFKPIVRTLTPQADAKVDVTLRRFAKRKKRGR